MRASVRNSIFIVGIPRHAMRVMEHRWAQGAILGKAMQRLEAGHTGQIMVLVTLQ